MFFEGGVPGGKRILSVRSRDAAMTIFEDILKTTERYNLKEGN